MTIAKGHGGSRPGAGRKPGIPNRRSYALADRVAADGITPVVMLTKLSRRLYYTAMRSGSMEAAELAVKAVTALVPYTEAKLSPISRSVDIGPLTGSLSEQGCQVFQALSDGRVSPDEAARMMEAISAQARVIEVSELAERLAHVERQLAQKRKRLHADQLNARAPTNA